MKTVRQRIEDTITPDMVMARSGCNNEEIQLTHEERESLTMAKTGFPHINPVPYLKLREMKPHNSKGITPPRLKKMAIEVGLNFSF